MYGEGWQNWVSGAGIPKKTAKGSMVPIVGDRSFRDPKNTAPNNTPSPALMGDPQRSAGPGSSGSGVIPSGNQTQSSGEDGNKFQKVTNNLTGAIKIYESMGDNKATRNAPHSYNTGIIQDNNRQSQISRPSRSSSRSYRTSSSGGGGVIAGEPIKMPTLKMDPYPDLPEFKSPEYTPPGEDPRYEAGKRQEMVGNQAQQLRRMTQEQVLASRSLSNPVARREAARAAIGGYGQGLGKIYDAAAGRAAQQASRKRAEDMKIYNMKYSTMRGDAVANYENQLNTLVQNWIAGNQQKAQQFEMEKANYMSQPLSQRKKGDSKTNSGGQLARSGYSLRMVN